MRRATWRGDSVSKRDCCGVKVSFLRAICSRCVSKMSSASSISETVVSLPTLKRRALVANSSDLPRARST